MTFDEKNTYVVYDGDCPFCSQYVKLLRLRQAIGPVALINARDGGPVVDHVRSRGIDLNEEMALVMNGDVFSGAECMHRLAFMSTGAGPFNAVMAKVFASPGVSRAIYPWLRAGRNLTLKALGRSPLPIR